MPFMGIGGDAFRVIEAKTASYQMLPSDHGKIFTNRGASGSVTLTLPVVTDIQTGWWVEIFSAVLAQALVVASQGSSDNITTFNDLTADSITINTTGEMAGFGLTMVWDGTGWLTFIHSYETHSVTIA